MPELRKDYVLDRWVIIATERAKRPHDFQQETIEHTETTCVFCPGNEKNTPNEILRYPETGAWNIRVVPNKYPAVKREGDATIKTHNTFYTFADAYGSHEIIIETADHKKQLWDLPIQDIETLLHIYQQRISTLLSMPGIHYVQIFKNHGPAAGTSISHSHTQLIGHNTIPKGIRDEHTAIQAHSSCPYCAVIQREKDSYRRCFENNTMIAFTPYASRFPFEIIILPKKHTTTLAAIENYADLASILKQILIKLKEINAPYNLLFHYSPQSSNIHFHIEILPRLALWGGFEFTGTIINPLAPEDAAKFYRGEK